MPTRWRLIAYGSAGGGTSLPDHAAKSGMAAALWQPDAGACGRAGVNRRRAFRKAAPMKVQPFLYFCIDKRASMCYSINDHFHGDVRFVHRWPAYILCCLACKVIQKSCT